HTCHSRPGGPRPNLAQEGTERTDGHDGDDWSNSSMARRGRSGFWKLKSTPRDAGGLAATPTFATMALLTAVLGADAQNMVCAAQGSSLLSGMSAMYVLMAAFHSTPWLKLIFGGGRHRASAGRFASVVFKAE